MVVTKEVIRKTQHMIQYLRAVDPATKRRLSHYAQDSVLRGYVTTCRFIAKQSPYFSSDVGLDFGCELGVCAYMLTLFGAPKVYCYDHAPVEYIIDQVPHLAYTHNGPWTRKYNWVLMNDVLYLNHPDGQQEIIKAAVEHLSPKGRLIISDEDSDSINRNITVKYCQNQNLNITVYDAPNWRVKLYHRYKGIVSPRFYIVAQKRN